MRVIGTAGHVDHGKTALIRSMTGIDADRLPEEKARGMTTDLGFAYYRGGSGELVGVVDVPGHERFLRNMVAGAWGLDLALLVVAADDGWMPQTSLHAAIVASLASPAVVIAVTKIDAVDAARAATVASEAVERAATLFGSRPEVVLVSNATREGIAELKAAVDRALEPRPAPRQQGAYLYVDRAFSPLGGGTVVTGTLVDGSLGVGDEALILPSGERTRIRGLQSYRERVERAYPTCRAAVSLAGLKGGIGRGDLLASPEADILVGTEFLCRLLPLPGSGLLCSRDAKGRASVRAGLEAEFAVGSARRDASAWPLSPGDFVRVVVREPLACPAGDGFALLRRGGAELLARGVVVRAGKTAAEDRKRLQSSLAPATAVADRLASAGRGRDDALGLRVALDAFYRGWTYARGNVSSEAATLAGLEAATVPDGGTMLFDPARWQRIVKALAAAAAEPGGLSPAAGASLCAAILAGGGESGTDWRERAFDAVASRLVVEKALEKRGASYFAPGSTRDLSPEEGAVLARLSAAGKAGLEPGKSAPQADARLLKALCSFGLAMPLDGDIFFSKATFDEVVEAILRGRRAGDRFSVPEAKERSGLSRKYILPLLNRMESRGLVKRSGDERLVL